MPHIYPLPAQQHWGKLLGQVRNVRIYSEIQCSFCTSGLPPDSAAEGTIDAEVYIGDKPPLAGFQEDKRYVLAGEGYWLEIKETGGSKAAVWITARGPRGYYYGSVTFSQLLCQPLRAGWILDRPLMKVRGIVEGYYGRPWTQEERIRALSIMGAHKMNTYIYAPKNDPYHREKWGIPYPLEEEQAIRELISHCRERFVDFVFAVSPGYTIRYSSMEDLDRLMNKYQQLYRYGVRRFGLFFDDIPENVWHPEDRLMFKDLAEGQIHFILHVFARLKELDPMNRLMVCPTRYFGRGDESYITRLGEALPEEIQLLWTGRTICSPQIEAREARIFYEYTRHRPLYWDNYPVNDANMRDEMHIGPLINRDPSLFLYAEGLIANVMEYAETSLIPMITIAHYLWNPPAYDPPDSFRIAVQSIVGERDARAFLTISECINQSSLVPVPGQQLLMKWWEHQRIWNSDPQAKESFHQLVREYKASADRLLNMENEKLQAELLPWIKQVREDLDFLLQVMEAGVEDETVERARQKYGEKVTALGFIPYLIANEMYGGLFQK